MNNYISILIAAGLVVMALVLVIVILHTPKKKKKQRSEEGILTAEEKRTLKAQAAAQYEAAMVRELKHFESQLGSLSTSLLEEVRQDVKGSDQAITQAASQLTTQLSQEYAGLMSQATSQLKLHITSAEQAVAKDTAAMQTELSAIVEARKQATLKRVDTELADILSQYLNATLEQLDLTDQEQFILAKLEEIKPQLREDLARVQ